MAIEVKALRMAGRCRDGGERDGGRLFHAVPIGELRAVCGALIGRHSAGWSSHPGEAVTCGRCRAKLDRENPSLYVVIP